MTTLQLPGAEDYEQQMEMHTSTENTDISLSRVFEKIFHTQHGHIACWITASMENAPSKRK